MSIQLQLPAKNSSYSRLEVARLFLKVLAFGCSDHNLEFHLPVYCTESRPLAKYQAETAPLSVFPEVFQGFDGGNIKKYHNQE